MIDRRSMDPIPHGPYSRASRCVVDGLVVARNQVWPVVAEEDDESLALLLAEPLAPGEPPLRMCREIVDDAHLLIGDADPEQDHLLSELIRGDRCVTS